MLDFLALPLIAIVSVIILLTIISPRRKRR